MKLEGDNYTSTCNCIFDAFTKWRGRGRTKSYQKNEAKRGAAGCLILRERMNVHGPLKKGGASLSRFYHRVLHSGWGASLMVYLREEESGKFFTPKMAKIADFSIAKLQTSGRFPQRSVEPVFSQHFWISFADIPLPRPPCLCAVPYGESSFNVKLESRWKRSDSYNWFARIGQARPRKTRMFQWKSRYLKQQDLP